MKPKKIDPLVGHQVVVNADALNHHGDAHEFAGMTGKVVERTKHGSYQVQFGDDENGLQILPMDSFSVVGASATVVETSALPETAVTPIPMIATMAMMERVLIVPSLTNPRKHFDEEFLQELAASIKLQGLGQPILIRPLPASRVEETSAGSTFGVSLRTVRPTHEIVAGEQRWRACGIAGVLVIPVLIRELTDEQVLQLQLVENLKRRDLHAMEAAEGYEQLMAISNLTADQLAETIGKSKSYVYKALKLLDLSADSRKAFYDGKLTPSTALLVSRHIEQHQAEIIKTICQPTYAGEVMSYRNALDYIHRNYMLKLSEAPFKITDALLLPAAGSCRACPKRAGAAPDLFADVTAADTCTDPKCFAAKKDAHSERLKAEALAKGQTLITGKDAKAILKDQWSDPKGYKLLDKREWMPAADGSSQHTTLRKVLGKSLDEVVLVESPHTKELVAMVPNDVANKLLKEKGIVKGRTVEDNAKHEKAKATEKYHVAWRKRAVVAIVEKSATFTERESLDKHMICALRLAAHKLIPEGADVKPFCKLLGLEGEVGVSYGLTEHINNAKDGEVEAMVLAALAWEDVEWRSWISDSEETPHITALADAMEIDLAAIKKAVQAEMRAEGKAKAAKAEQKEDKPDKAAPAGGKAAAPAKPARKPKTSKAEAAAAIAQALQAAEGGDAEQVDGARPILKGEHLEAGGEVDADAETEEAAS